jgi:hypothetical protein
MPTEKEQELLDRLARCVFNLQFNVGEPPHNTKLVDASLREIVRDELSKSLDGISCRLAVIEEKAFRSKPRQDDWTQK